MNKIKILICLFIFAVGCKFLFAADNTAMDPFTQNLQKLEQGLYPLKRTGHTVEELTDRLIVKKKMLVRRMIFTLAITENQSLKERVADAESIPG